MNQSDKLFWFCLVEMAVFIPVALWRENNVMALFVVVFTVALMVNIATTRKGE